MRDTNTTVDRTADVMRYIVVGALVLAAFFGAYGYASARDRQGDTGAAGLASALPASGGGLAAQSGCACCGNAAPTQDGLTGEKVEAAATVEGDVQRIEVDLSQGYYNPNQIVLAKGVPAEITFGQSSGCTAQVASQELGFFEDLSAGSRVVKLPALEAGEYPFYCGMQMVFGKIVVR